MEQINGIVRVGEERSWPADVKARSGLLISKGLKPEPAKITRLKNEKVIVHRLD